MIPDGTSRAELSELELGAWRGMLRIHHRIRRELGAELTSRYGLSMADYDALVTLAAQPDGELRMAVLAEEILQPRSSTTRIIGGLEQRGLVRRGATPGDGRGASARLTTAGRRLFAQAHRTHLSGVRARFLDHLTTEQLAELTRAWAAIDPSVLGGAQRTEGVR